MSFRKHLVPSQISLSNMAGQGFHRSESVTVSAAWFLLMALSLVSCDLPARGALQQVSSLSTFSPQRSLRSEAFVSPRVRDCRRRERCNTSVVRRSPRTMQRRQQTLRLCITAQMFVFVLTNTSRLCATMCMASHPSCTQVHASTDWMTHAS